MKKSRYFPVYILLCLSAYTVKAADDLSIFKATYKLFTHGIEAGVVNRGMIKSENENEYIYHSEIKTTGLAALFKKVHIIEKSIWKLDNDKLIPLNYSYQRWGESNDDEKMEFDWQNMMLNKQYNGKKVSVAIPDNVNVLDKLLYQYALMFDLKNGIIPDDYIIMDKRKIKTYKFKFQGKENIETPIGNFETYKILRTSVNSNKKTFLWCAIELDYLPIKLVEYKDNDEKSIAMIDSVSGF